MQCGHSGHFAGGEGRAVQLTADRNGVLMSEQIMVGHVPKVLDCGHPPTNDGPLSTGYGTDRAGKTFCYACCAENDKKAMIEDGRACMYLVSNKDHRSNVVYNVTNWLGSLKFQVYHHRVGKHNIAGSRIDAWFKGPDGFVWHAKQYGTMSDICHCKRTKER